MAYTKKTWVTGETIQAADLNHLESGVEAISANGAIDTANLADGAVTDAKIADGAIYTAKLADDAVTYDKLDQNAVDSVNIRTGAVTTAKIADGAVTAAKLGADVSAVLDNKANIDGSYESMTVGNAEQLVSSVGIEEQTPYNFRTSGGSTEIGDREELNAVVGATVAWNQLAENGNFETTNGWVTSASSLSVSDGIGTWATTAASANLYRNHPVLQNHIYMLSCRIKTDSALTNVVYLRFSGTNVIGNNAATEWQSLNGLFKRTNAAGTTTLGLYKPSTNAVTVEVSDFQSFDLTQMLGSTIADYIYSLEQSNAGAGVAYFRKLFPKPYYAYNSGKLLSVQTSAHKMVGFNQWDEQWENGRFNITTGAASTGNGLRNKNMIRVIPNTVYHAVFGNYSQGVVILLYYDANGGFLSYEAKYSADFNFTTPDSACYLNFNLQTSSAVTAYHNDICIDISWDGERNGEYMPYVEHVYPLDSSLTLRGILKLDASNNLYADGDRYLPDGTVTRKRRQIVADGDTVKVTEVNQSNGIYWCRLTTLSSSNKGVDSTTTETRIITDKGYRDYPSVGVGNIYINNNGISPIICLFDQTLTTVSAVNTYLASNPITIEYELATPTTEAADPYPQTQIVDDFGTEEFVDAAVETNERDVAIPVGNETVYKPNLRAKLEMAPDSPDGGDGDYIVRQTNGTNSYIPLVEVKELPDMPSEDGSYKLRCTVSNGTATLSWISDS